MLGRRAAPLIYSRQVLRRAATTSEDAAHASDFSCKLRTLAASASATCSMLLLNAECRIIMHIAPIGVNLESTNFSTIKVLRKKIIAQP